MAKNRLPAWGVAFGVACLAMSGCSLVVDGRIADDEGTGGSSGHGGQGGQAGSGGQQAGSGGGGMAGEGGSGGMAGEGGAGSGGMGGTGGTGGMDGGVAGMGGSDAGPDGGGMTGFDCTGEADGVDCGETRNDDAGVSEPSGLICLDEVCRPSTCGDGFVDRSLGEQCEDGNNVAGDGCEPESCTWTCEQDEDCIDTFFCNGTESCDPEAHVCQAGEPQDGETCEIDDGGSGTCNEQGYCVPAGCGNGNVDSGEDCDYGESGPFPGCEYDCTFTCTSNADCDDGNVCNGQHACQCDGDDVACSCTQDSCNTRCVLESAPLSCEEDEDACTQATCDPERGCIQEPIQDEDGDGFVAEEVDPSCGDCMDTPNDNLPGVDPADINPNALEQCDDIDNDCDDVVDEEVTEITCYRDFDGDDFGTRQITVTDCSCPEGYIPPRSDQRFDCIDGRSGSIYASVHPGGTWSRSHYSCDTEDCRRDCEASENPDVCASGWDFDCDGAIEPRWTRDGATRDDCNALAGNCALESGWVGEAPGCGEKGTYLVCDGLLGAVGCSSRELERTQECR